MKNINDDYLTDEALEELISSVEAGPLLRPPKGFKSDIITQIQRKRKYKKNMQLFSYSMKVIAATAASVGIVLVVPNNISTDESKLSGVVSEWQEDNADSQSDNTDNQKDNADSHFGRIEKKHGRDTEKSYDERFIYRINKHMDEYVSIVNEKLNQFVRMEVNFNEEEEK